MLIDCLASAAIYSFGDDSRFDAGILPAANLLQRQYCVLSRLAVALLADNFSP